MGWAWVVRGARNFSFNHHWMLEDNYKSVISGFWSNTSINGNIPPKLQNVAKNLAGWATISIGSISNQIRSIRKRIENHREIEDPDIQRGDCGYLEGQLEKLLAKEEIYWK